MEPEELPYLGLRPWLIWTFNQLMGFLEAAVVFSIVIVVVLAITQMAGRQQFLALLSEQIDDVEAQIIDLGSEQSAGLEDLRNLLVDLKSLRRDAASLVAIGADQIQHTLANLRSRRDSLSTKPGEFVGPHGMYLTGWAWPISQASNDLLLAIVVIGCGAIGSGCVA